MLDQIEIDLRGADNLTLYINVADNSLSRKWLAALNDIIRSDLHLEKNYCWLGWTESQRNAEYIIDQINLSIESINAANLDEAVRDEVFQLGHKGGRRELIGQHRGDSDRDRGRHLVAGQRVELFQQRQVRVDRGFAQPVAAVRPPSVVQHPRQVAMERQNKIHDQSLRPVWCIVTARRYRSR